ncbi:hypothetical protein H6G74_09520 [Nostoc spongiaeforme FACHB-130]|uniref:Uncharacterized protein n=1 Tax=Nostoc spongiaeforme FACHB-130 TaxID=1357510 RepID=A0ABR8FT46_9NOSO|nr:T3SS effector HopA1 family protein [Nostoc spongiaeforme]MBD2594563.1 hypothetical protein [Nostoc spongiaeforme FACHB-130]
MQMLDSIATQLAEIPESLQISLQDIISQIEIESDYCIKHPNYKPLQLPESAISRFQQLPAALKKKFLSMQLRGFLYGIYYNGSLKSSLAVDTETNTVALNQNLENNTLLGVDVAFYDRLHESNQGDGYWYYNWQVVKENLDHTLAVQKDGLTLHIERSRHLLPQHQSATVGKYVAVKMPKNLVQNGFYMAVANAGTATNRERLVRVYFNVTPEGAVAVMQTLTTQLNFLEIPFSLKALYNPSDYERYDSAVFYFDKKDYETIHPVLERVYVECQSYFQPEVPLFTKFMAPGLAIAEEPNRRFAEQESFGTHRCQIIANGLLNAWEQGNDTPAHRLAAILEQFSLFQVELQRPYLNANSADIYMPLSLS